MLCHANGNSETHFLIVYRYNLLMFLAYPVCMVRPILNLAWNNITNCVYASKLSLRVFATWSFQYYVMYIPL